MQVEDAEKQVETAMDQDIDQANAKTKNEVNFRTTPPLQGFLFLLQFVKPN